MSLPKFLSLVQTKALFFSNLELMARADPFEGTLPVSRFEHRKWKAVDDIPQHVLDKLTITLPIEESLLSKLEHLKNLAELRIRQAYAYRRTYFINCWHLNQHESSAMWDIYSRRNEGIAVVSSEERFIESLGKAKTDVYGGKIIYGDYFDDDFRVDDGNAFAPILHKRTSFAYESEYRLVFRDAEMTSKYVEINDGVFWHGEKAYLLPWHEGIGSIDVGMEIEEVERLEIKPGHALECDLTALVEKIYISPLAEDWFLNIVKDAARVYGLTAPVIRSELIAEPLK